MAELLEISSGAELFNQAILEALPDTFFQVDRFGIVLQFKATEWFSFFLPEGEVIGRHINHILPVFDKAMEEIIAALETGELQTQEFLITQNNSNIFVEARITKMGTDNALILLRDISEWNRFQDCDLLIMDLAAKVQQERPLGEILHFACQGIKSIFSANIVQVAYKDTAQFLRIYTIEKQFTAFSPENFIDLEEGKDLLSAALRTGKFQIMATKDPRMLEWCNYLNNNRITTGGAFPLKVGSLVFGALILFADDQSFWSKRKIVQLTNTAEQIALAIHTTVFRQRIRLLNTALESAANAIVIIDRRGFIQWVNPAFLELTSYRLDEIDGKNINFIESGFHPRTFYKSIQRHVLVGRIWHGEIINRRKDGGSYTAETTITPVRDKAGKINNFIAVIQDISARKRAETEMLEARETVTKAERLSAIGIMTAGIAHEINQPLNSLKVIADGMLYWFGKGREPDINELIDNIREISKDADRIDSIIKHMRSFIYNSEFNAPVLCDINIAVEESLRLLGAQILSHNILVKTVLDTPLPNISGSSVQLEQIIINLLINAIHALDSVEKSDKTIIISTGQSSKHVFLAVTDNGSGINQAIKDKIFDPFFTTKAIGSGMGLGLSIVNSIVNSYGGQITVKNNNPEEGTTFLIEFPVAKENPKGDGAG